MKLPLPAYIMTVLLSLLLLPSLGLGISYFYTRAQPRIYASSALVITHAVKANDPAELATEFEIIQSKQILKPVLKSLIEKGEWTFRDDNADQVPEELALNIFRTKHLRVQPYRNTKLIEISVFSENPKQAKTAANALALAYVAHGQETKVKDAESAFLRGQTELVSEAEETFIPVRPNIKLNVILGFVSGLTLAFLFLLLLTAWYKLGREKGSNTT